MCAKLADVQEVLRYDQLQRRLNCEDVIHYCCCCSYTRTSATPLPTLDASASAEQLVEDE